MCKVVHAVPGVGELWNGISVASKLITEKQNATIIDVKNISSSIIKESEVVWVHSMWTPQVWRACWLALKGKKPLVRMLHGCVDPVRLNYHGWKKWLVGSIERYLLRRCERIVATCEAEKGWIEAYLGKRCPKVEIVDLKRFFDLAVSSQRLAVSGDGCNSEQETRNKKLHILYLGRRHPLKGVEYLEAAVAELNDGSRNRESKLNSGIGNFSNVEGLSVHCSTSTSNFDSKQIELKIVSNAFGEEKEKVWEWCDVLVLPTLSENFGLVVAEALERGKRVITTDGAPVWDPGDSVGVNLDSNIRICYNGQLLYLKGYRAGTKEIREEDRGS